MPTKRRSSSSTEGSVATSPMVVANWKMQLGLDQSVKVASTLKTKLRAFGSLVKVGVCPSFPSLAGVGDALAGSKIHLGSQDIFWDERGAYTGGVSPLDLQALGVEYVLVGHSERRNIFNEDDTMVARKMISVVTHGMMPILCVGESAADRTSGRHDLAVSRQLQAAFRSLPPPRQGRRMTVAYEPIWAIGTGEPADPAHAESMRQLIHQTLVDLYGESLADGNFRILYGGSVSANNVTDYAHPDGFHGALVSTASLEPGSFVDILQRVKRAFS